MLDKEKVKNNFSRHAHQYDQHAILQKEMADELIRYLGTKVPRGQEKPRNLDALIPGYFTSILDIGCGTGYLTNQIFEKLNPQKIIGCDIAPNMIKVARENYPNLEFIEANGENLLFEDGSFDLVISNAALQWMDINKALIEIHRVLKPNGTLFFATFGAGTLKELKQLAPHSAHRLPPILKIQTALKIAGLKISQLDSETKTVFYSSARELFSFLKNIGAQNANKNNDGLTGKNKMAKLIKDYEKNYTLNNKIYASFEVIIGQSSKN